MDLNNSLAPWSLAMYQAHAQKIKSELLNLHVNQLMTLYSISQSLAINVYDMIHSSVQPQAAIGYYKGEAYRYLDGLTMNQPTQKNAQSSLRILCALYGYLKPFDAITPYRMDFLVDFHQLGFESSTLFWRDKISNALCDECLNQEIVFNLASKEFSRVLDQSKIIEKCYWIDVDFLVYKNGKFKTVSMIAKKARGLFARALLEKPIENINDIYSIVEFDEFLLDKSNSHPNYLRYIYKKK